METRKTWDQVYTLWKNKDCQSIKKVKSFEIETKEDIEPGGDEDGYIRER